MDNTAGTIFQGTLFETTEELQPIDMLIEPKQTDPQLKLDRSFLTESTVGTELKSRLGGITDMIIIGVSWRFGKLVEADLDRNWAKRRRKGGLGGGLWSN